MALRTHAIYTSDEYRGMKLGENYDSFTSIGIFNIAIRI